MNFEEHVRTDTCLALAGSGAMIALLPAVRRWPGELLDQQKTRCPYSRHWGTNQVTIAKRRRCSPDRKNAPLIARRH